VGSTVLPDQGLPQVIDQNGFDEPSVLGAFVDAMRWGAVTNADDKAFQAPFRTGANLEPYQLEPLRRALGAPRTNLLLADDVGLGKTIEAGLVVKELLLRHRARSVIVVCPPSLCEKWAAEMSEKFGLDFKIVDAKQALETRREHGLAANPLKRYPRVIVSMAWLAMPRAQRLFAELYSEVDSSASARSYAFDVLVVDEAHHVAPSAPSAAGNRRGYAVDSQRTVAVRELAKRCEHRLFLSATPHNGYSESFTALLEMVDPRRFSRGARIDRTALDEVTVRRLKTDIAGRGFKPRVIKQIPFTPRPDEEERYAELDALLKESARGREGEQALGVASLLLRKRFLSSPWSFSTTVAAYCQAAEDDPYDWSGDDYYAEVMGSGQADDEEGRFEQPEFETLQRTKGNRPLSAASAEALESLCSWGAGHQARPNGRLEALVAWLDALCRPEGRDRWTDERAVVFTEYADTLSWIEGVLRSRGYDADRLAVIQGSTDPEERELVRARFCADPAEEKVRVLLATDAAGEGIDLQTWCHRLVNFDVPFNPSRLEQRIGRIDRYGQRHNPEVYYFSADGSNGMYRGEYDFMERIAKKVATERGDLGSVNPVIDDKVYGHFTNMPRNRGAAVVQEANNQTIDQVLSGTRQAGQALDRQITNLERTFEETRAALHITPAAERRVVDTALALTHQLPLVPRLDAAGEPTGVYTLPEKLNASWRGVTSGLTSALDRSTVLPITFDSAQAQADPHLAYVHLGSSLLAKASRTLRGSLYTQESALNRVTAVVVPGLDHTCAAAMARLVLVGRGGVRVHEEVFVTGIRFRGANLAEGKVQDLLDGVLDAGDLELAGPGVRRVLAAEWQANGGHLKRRLEEEVGRRAERRKAEVEGNLAKRLESELARVRGIYDAFELNLRDSIDQLDTSGGYQLQLDLDNDEQRRQRLRDLHAMHDRLDTLADERERELESVRERYRDPRPYVTIAALVFAVAPHNAQEWEARS
jgi:superfamily II DNA or RNA helicase